MSVYLLNCRVLKILMLVLVLAVGMEMQSMMQHMEVQGN